jgi:glycosyltransferase involved in cell wall biosynthesis
MSNYIVADYQPNPSEGMQVISKMLVDGIRAHGQQVTVIRPQMLMRELPRLIARRPERIVFTHGPGNGVVLASTVLRRLTRARIVWVATRPELATVPAWLKGRRTAHSIVCNRERPDLASVAPGAEMLQQFIGIDSARLNTSAPYIDPWPEITSLGRPIALHVGHLRRSRGLDLLVDAKRALGDRLEIVVQGSPTFAPDPDVLEELETAGVHVRRGFVADLANLYRASDLYVFPARHEDAGAIELPLGVLEAVACAKPVLTNDFGVLKAALSGVDGVHISNPERFVSDLQAILDDPQGLSRRPIGLPDHLHAARVMEAVIGLLGGSR